MNGSEVEGIAIHYAASEEPFGPVATLATTVRRLEEERRLHTTPQPDGPGYVDIAYQVAMDVDGRVFDCRGIGFRSDSNGNEADNHEYGAVTWILGIGDRPTAALVNAFRLWRQEHWLPRYPRATKIVGHRDLCPTECPGDSTYALIRSGALTKGVDVPLTDAEIDAIATRTRDKILAVTYGSQPDGQPFTLAMLWGEVRVNAIKAATGIDIDALASSIVSKLPPGQGGHIDPQTIAVAVADELSSRLRS
jgi:hypothetical protein